MFCLLLSRWYNEILALLAWKNPLLTPPEKVFATPMLICV